MKTPALLPALILFAAPLAAQTLNGNWEFGVASGSLTSPGGSTTGFSITTNGNNATATTYFAPGGSPVTLSVGQTLSLSFDLTVDFAGITTGRNDAFRFGLHNTGNSQTTGNNYSVTGNSAWTGYSIWTPDGTGQTSPLVRLLDRTSTNNIVYASGANTNLSTQTYTTGTFVDGTYNNNTLSVTRTSIDTVSISGSIAGQSFNSVLDSTNAVFAFDALHFFGSGSSFGDGGTITVSDLSLTTTAIPEPSAFAGLAGLGVLGLVALRRRPRV